MLVNQTLTPWSMFWLKSLCLLLAEVPSCLASGIKSSGRHISNASLNWLLIIMMNSSAYTAIFLVFLIASPILAAPEIKVSQVEKSAITFKLKLLIQSLSAHENGLFLLSLTWHNEPFQQEVKIPSEMEVAPPHNSLNSYKKHVKEH